jgi:hypothetical protein
VGIENAPQQGGAGPRGTKNDNSFVWGRIHNCFRPGTGQDNLSLASFIVNCPAMVSSKISFGNS